MSLEVRWVEGSKGPLQVNSLDLKNPKKAWVKAAQSITGLTLTTVNLRLLVPRNQLLSKVFLAIFVLLKQ